MECDGRWNFFDEVIDGGQMTTVNRLEQRRVAHLPTITTHSYQDVVPSTRDDVASYLVSMVGIGASILTQEELQHLQVTHGGGTGKGRIPIFIDLIDENIQRAQPTHRRQQISLGSDV